MHPESEITAAVINLIQAERRLRFLLRRSGHDPELSELTRQVRETGTQLWERVINKAD